MSLLYYYKRTTFMSKIVLITGASRGIGAAIAHRFAKEGYSLIITCNKSADALFSLKKSLEELYHIPVLASVGNIGDSAYACRLFDDRFESTPKTLRALLSFR